MIMQKAFVVISIRRQQHLCYHMINKINSCLRLSYTY